MTNPFIERRPQVEIDLFEIAKHIAGDNLAAAMAFLQAVEKTFSDLALTPGLGRLRSFNIRLPNIRSWRVNDFANYLIFYQQCVGGGRDGISIIRVLHAARDLESILEE